MKYFRVTRHKKVFTTIRNYPFGRLGEEWAVDHDPIMS